MGSLGPVSTANDLVDQPDKLYKRHSIKIREILKDLQDGNPEIIVNEVKKYLTEKQIEFLDVRVIDPKESYMVKIGVEIILQKSRIMYTIKDKIEFDKYFKSVE